jgi:hypothetical protein
MFLTEKIVEVLQNIDRAAQRSGRTAKDIRLVAVTKTIPGAIVLQALAAGITDIGENRVQEAKAKYSLIGSQAKWHLIGHLQTNKVKTALEIFNLIHSVDSLDLAKEIDRKSEVLKKKANILIQVNTSFEKSKFGCEPDRTPELVEEVASMKNIQIHGLMTIGAFLPNPEQVRPSFAYLRELRDKIKEQSFPGVSMEILSMGMSNDYRVAIEEGSNMIRVGTAIFGARNTVMTGKEQL